MRCNRSCESTIAFCGFTSRCSNPRWCSACISRPTWTTTPTASAGVNDLTEAAEDRTLPRAVARYGRVDLLCVDELGYLHLDPRGAELLFQVITEREERASIAIATNAPFSEWGQTFTDPRLAAAIVDRLTFNAHIIETGHDSYRLRTTRTRPKGVNTKK